MPAQSSLLPGSFLYICVWKGQDAILMLYMREGHLVMLHKIKKTKVEHNSIYFGHLVHSQKYTLILVLIL